MNRALFAMLIAVSIGALGWGFAIVGGPGQARMEKNDATRFGDLRRLGRHYRCAQYRLSAAEQAVSPTQCSGAATTAPDLKDPVTQETYRFAKTSETSFEVCATFQVATSAQDHNRAQGFVFDGHEGCIVYTRPDGQANWILR